MYLENNYAEKVRRSRLSSCHFFQMNSVLLYWYSSYRVLLHILVSNDLINTRMLIFKIILVGLLFAPVNVDPVWIS